jgi:thiosulfate/3-mercaptopyruvate sulfurtransferase
LEPWQKVLVGSAFSADVHSHIPCIDCHSGDATTADKAVAHTDLVARPSRDAERVCGDCHHNVTATHSTSLHRTLDGYWRTLETRSVPENHDALSEMFGNHCSACHASCGDCHVSQPSEVGSGFFSGHSFERTPPMTRSCTACHGSRVGNEYLGKNEGIRADVHFRQGRMTCVACHTSAEMHGQPSNSSCQECHAGPVGTELPPDHHRYDGVQTPSCGSCHITATTGQDGIAMHIQHSADLSCQVCHSVEYMSCDGCHVAISERTGKPFYGTEANYMTFFIGRNPLRSGQRPYLYVPVRHIPIAPTSYEFYGDDLLPNFDELNTWAYATPHNIQRVAPQAESCNACHGNADIFLTEDKVQPGYVNANRNVIVPQVPPLLGADGTPLTATGSITLTETITTTGTTP